MLSLFKRNSSPAAAPKIERPSGAYGTRGAKHGSGARPSLRPRSASSRPTSPPNGRVAGGRQAELSNEAEAKRELHKDALQQALATRRHSDALQNITSLIALDPSDPRWPHKYGDVLRSMGRPDEAAAAYRRAARRYELFGFPLRAQALVRLAGELDTV